MTRPLQAPTAEEIDAADHEAFGRALAYWGVISQDGDPSEVDLSAMHPWVRTLFYSPQFALHRAELSSLVRGAGERPGSYSHYEREMVDQVLAPYMGTNVVQPTHIPDGMATGISAETIEALYEGRDDDLSEGDRQLTSYIRQVVDGTVTDESFAGMEARMGRRGLVEYTYFITVLWMTMRQQQAFGSEDPSDAEILDLVRDIKTGKRDTGDWRHRIRTVQAK